MQQCVGGGERTCGAVWGLKIGRCNARDASLKRSAEGSAACSSGMSLFGGRAGISGRGGGAEDIDSGSPQI